MYYVQNKCIFLKTVRIQISKGLKKVQNSQLSSIMLYRNKSNISSYTHTEKFSNTM